MILYIPWLLEGCWFWNGWGWGCEEALSKLGK